MLNRRHRTFSRLRSLCHAGRHLRFIPDEALEAAGTVGSIPAWGVRHSSMHHLRLLVFERCPTVGRNWQGSRDTSRPPSNALYGRVVCFFASSLLKSKRHGAPTAPTAPPAPAQALLDQHSSSNSHGVKVATEASSGENWQPLATSGKRRPDTWQSSGNCKAAAAAAASTAAEAASAVAEHVAMTINTATRKQAQQENATTPIAFSYWTVGTRSFHAFPKLGQ